MALKIVNIAEELPLNRRIEEYRLGFCIIITGTHFLEVSWEATVLWIKDFVNFYMTISWKDLIVFNLGNSLRSSK